MKRLSLIVPMLLASSVLIAQNAPENSDDRMYCYRMKSGVREEILIPDAAGYLVLKADLHIHTVYADGTVSPKGRLMEAWHDGLDIVCVSEHIGGKHQEGISFKDHNLVNRQAAAAAKKTGLLVIPGVEINRSKPFGHMNALFVKDASRFSTDLYELDENGNIKRDSTGRRITNMKTLREDIDEMVRQGCFIQWNHPGWPDRKCDIFDIQKEMIAGGHIHAVEICNNTEWYPKVLDFFDEYHIPMTANTDTHTPTSYEFGHCIRPMNLILAKDYSLESVRKAMEAGRIVAFWDQTLAGDEKWVKAIVESCLKVRVIDEKKGTVAVTNLSDIRFETRWGDHMNPVVFYPRSSVIVKLGKGEKVDFLNCYTGRATLKMNLR